jgi:hypothetical protein
MDDAYVRSPSEVLKHFQVSENRGLSSGRVKAQRETFGPNGTWIYIRQLDIIMFADCYR